jgi:hypothetical protein
VRIEMNAYVMTADGARVIEGGGWLEVHPDDIVVVRSDDAERRPMAAVKLSERLWVALGERPPEPWSGAGQAPAATPALVGDGEWPPEPPPDVDSQG